MSANGNVRAGYGRAGFGSGGRPFRRNNGGPRFPGSQFASRDLEGELLSKIWGEFQVMCSETRPFDDIYHQVSNNTELHNFIYNSPDNLRKFINKYNEFFYFESPTIVRWTKERPVSKRDPKEPLRKEKREWNKKFDDTAITYCLVLEDDALSFITALFTVTNERWLNTESITKSVKHAFSSEVDLLDYCGASVRNFMLKRNHMFREHLDSMFFYGKNTYDVIYALNEVTRQAVQPNRENVSRLHNFYLTDSKISQDARDELMLNDREQFVQFMRRASFVFEPDGETHFSSKIDLPPLSFDPNVIKAQSLVDALNTFKELHDMKNPVGVKEKHHAAFVLDTDGNTRELGQRIDVSAGNPTPIPYPSGPGYSTGASSTISSASRAHASVINQNPFEKRQAGTSAGVNPSMAAMSLANAGGTTSNQRANIAPNVFLRAPGH